MDLFDFSSYFKSVLSVPPEQIYFQQLTGGLMNLTIRASFTPPANLFQFGHLSSAILKYAPPFMAADPTQPMSVHRQVIEAQALVLLSGCSIPAISEVLSNFPLLRIPKLIHHDSERHVLWMTDLGETQTLSQYLTSDPLMHDIERIATSFGAFLAELFRATRDPPDDIVTLFANPSHTAETYSFVISVMNKVLTTAGIANAELLAERVNEALQRNGTVEPCLGMADLWPGNILIDSCCNVGLVDWEYFGLSTASSELGMLGVFLSDLLCGNCD
jgi:Phosphotransferase enzyme family